MASIQDRDEVEVQEIAQEIVIDTDGGTGSVVDLTSEDPNDHEQEMEIDTGGEGTQNEDIHVQPPNDENNAPGDTEMQSSMQNVTPAIDRNVQVLGVSAVNSPDEFQNKASKPSSKTSSKVKSYKSPIKSPEKDDDVSLACQLLFLLFVIC